MNHSFHATAFFLLGDFSRNSILPAKRRDMALMAVEARGKGVGREDKENNPPKSMLGGKKALCEIQPSIGIVQKLPEFQCLMRCVIESLTLSKLFPCKVKLARS